MGKFVDLTGLVFNNIKVLEKSTERIGSNRRIAWVCECSCGKIITVAGCYLVNGDTKSCGCRRGVSKSTHGLSGHKLYGTWYNMVERCTNSSNISYKYYGGRGITVCDSWKNVENFINDMEGSYQEGMTLERVDTNKGYCKENCTWASPSVQAFNKRPSCKNSSGKVGVNFDKNSGKWKATICKNYIITYLGIYDSFEDAVEARKAAERGLYGFTVRS
jgi:hypothetical protein